MTVVFGTVQRPRKIAVVALLQCAWFACVAAAARGMPALGIAAVAAAVGVAWAWSPRRDVEIRLAGLAMAIGLVWDSALARTGLVEYASPQPVPGWAPAWIVALWILFAPMLCEPLRWLHGRPWLAALLGGVGGPLSYAAAERMGACAFAHRAQALAVLASGWAVFTPLLLAAAQRLEGRAASIAIAQQVRG